MIATGRRKGRELTFYPGVPKSIVLPILILYVCLFRQQERPAQLVGLQHEAAHMRDESMDKQKERNVLGAIVLLAPARNEVTFWRRTSRFCFLMRAVRSVDQHLNQHYGPYPIYILVANDYELHPRHTDGPYTEKDRALIRSWAPHSEIIFKKINLYSEDALEPGTTIDQITKWRKGEGGATGGRDLGYQSMCRLWSGRLQTMEFLRRFKYYLRIDDDSLFTEKLPFDPFQEMDAHGLIYAWRRDFFEPWGIAKLTQLINRHIWNETGNGMPFLRQQKYVEFEPYNNFHVSRVSFWASAKWQAFWNDLNEEHAFFKHRLGDAGVHAAAMMMMPSDKVARWSSYPYVHNSNDMRDGWAPEAWKSECEAAEDQYGIVRHG
jgi:Glycolipid 2-alpha-mannosyltransferase